MTLSKGDEMAGNLYMTMIAGIKTLVASLQTSAGAGDAGKIPALNSSGVLDLTIINGKVGNSGAGDSGKTVVRDTNGRIDLTDMPVGIGVEVATITAVGALAAGDWVNVYAATGVKCRKADATVAGKEANGFVLAAVTDGNSALVYGPSQTNTQLTGLTPGEMYWLSTTAGLGVATTPPSGSGNVVQRLGKATSSTTIVFMPDDPVTLA